VYLVGGVCWACLGLLGLLGCVGLAWVCWACLGLLGLLGFVGLAWFCWGLLGSVGLAWVSHLPSWPKQPVPLCKVYDCHDCFAAADPCVVSSILHREIQAAYTKDPIEAACGDIAP